mmetsp:Transcript_116343/g.276541  ORF Transcript_116343/g.276541 Transcript_116343/m.276541 type:complete len:225 (-) Transcript_116343:1166-1840(-)
MCASGAGAAEVTEERLEPSAGAAAAFTGDGPLGRHCGLDTEVDKLISPSSPPFLAHRVLGVAVLDGSRGVLTSRSAVVSLVGARTGADARRMNSSSSRIGPSSGAEGDGGGEEPETSAGRAPFLACRGVADSLEPQPVLPRKVWKSIPASGAGAAFNAPKDCGLDPAGVGAVSGSLRCFTKSSNETGAPLAPSACPVDSAALAEGRRALAEDDAGRQPLRKLMA